MYSMETESPSPFTVIVEAIDSLGPEARGTCEGTEYAGSAALRALHHFLNFRIVPPKLITKYLMQTRPALVI